MWRSFFFAVGISLMVLGAEALVFEQVEISQSAPVPEFLNKLIQPSDPLDVGFTPASQPQSPSQFPSPNANNGLFAGPFNSGGNPFNGSQFGPSRFSGPLSGGGYGGQRVDLSRSGLASNNNRSLGTEAYPVSFGTPAAASGGPANATPTSLSGRRLMVVKDWMPWSLLAAGAIIFLYTSSHRGSRDG